MNKICVLLVEPDRFLADMYTASLGSQFEVRVVSGSQEAIDALDVGQFDCVVADSMLGEHNGIELIHEIKSYDDWQNIPMILLSSVPISHIPHRQWLRYGIRSVLYKPQVHAKQLAKEIIRNTQPNALSV